ncbi:Hsp20/alpha crystallin family protein [Bacillus spongiae]|uniref:Hsp20/alpha crystallin family protein n=1 Tax=Bacillus spongiae TaxID=2683610 RepID=A0ABU8HFT8_9BACI
MGPFGGFNGFNPFKMMKDANPFNLQSQMKDIMEKNLSFDPKSLFGGYDRDEDEKDSESKTESYTVFETHEDVYIRIPIDSTEVNPKRIKVFYTSNRATIVNYPEDGNREQVILPCTVKRNGGKAVYRDGVLEVKMVKDWDHHYTEIDIHL